MKVCQICQRDIIPSVLSWLNMDELCLLLNIPRVNMSFVSLLRINFIRRYKHIKWHDADTCSSEILAPAHWRHCWMWHSSTLNTDTTPRFHTTFHWLSEQHEAVLAPSSWSNSRKDPWCLHKSLSHRLRKVQQHLPFVDMTAHPSPSGLRHRWFNTLKLSCLT